MKIRQLFRYVLYGSLLMLPVSSKSQNYAAGGGTFTQSYNAQPQEIVIDDIEKRLLEKKAKHFCEIYMQLSFNGRENIVNNIPRYAKKYGKGAKRRATMEELPGAPYGKHCLYGQCTELQRALDSLADTIKIVPETANKACVQFRESMIRKYSKILGCTCNGKIYAREKEYQQALKNFLQTKKVSPDDTVKITELKKVFDKNHRFIGDFNPGSIVILWTNGHWHAVMFAGLIDGIWKYSGFNNESYGNIFNSAFSLSNAFVLDVQNVMFHEYEKELIRIKKMSYQELIDYIYGNKLIKEYSLTYKQLRDMAIKKYFANIDQAGNSDETLYVPYFPVTNDY